ncbi:MAG: MarR family winged helix-turn-helix transcriptional regulator [Actinomycetota bacterium]|jgi:DNA-binding MarR family transcriptional regulator|nr:MarR family winged helix-turn-helix transcriptional regulator [Actinomycetota bacterium]
MNGVGKAPAGLEEPPTRSGRSATAPPARPAGRSTLDNQASELLLSFARLMRNSRHEEAAPSHIKTLLRSGELAPRHLGVFAVIALDGPLSVSELARQEGFALSTASLLVTQLADAGLVERREDPGDRRRTVVSVAPAHRRESEEVLASKLAPLRRALERMGKERAAALVQGLRFLAEEVGRTSSGSSDASVPAAAAFPSGSEGAPRRPQARPRAAAGFAEREPVKPTVNPSRE